MLNSFFLCFKAICEVDSFTTPRVTTPAAAQPSSTASHKQYFSTSFSHSRHRQSDPTEELWAAINQTEREKHETDTSLPHSRRRQPNSTEVWAALKQPKKENREPILPLKKRELDFAQKIPESSAFGASRTGLTGIDRPDAFRILERGNNDLSANNGRSKFVFFISIFVTNDILNCLGIHNFDLRFCINA